MTPAAVPATLPAPPAAIEPQGAPAAPTDAGAAALPREPAAQPSFAQLLAVGLASGNPASTADAETDLAPAAAVQSAATDAAATALAALGLPAALAAALSPPAQPQPGAPAAQPAQTVVAASARAIAPTPAAHAEAAEPNPSTAAPGDATPVLLRNPPEESRFAQELKTRSVEEPGLQERKNAEPALPARALEPMQAPHATNAAKPAAMAELPSRVASADWSRDLGDTVRWMAGAKQSVAELRLNPPELGPLQIVLTLGGDDQRQASVAFVSPHGEVRQAIEAALPQLRDMLAGSGIQLGDASVNAQGAHADARSQAGRRDSGRASEPLPEARASAASSSGIARLRDGAGLIDIFA